MNEKLTFLIFASPFIIVSSIGFLIMRDALIGSIPLFLLIFASIPFGVLMSNRWEITDEMKGNVE